MGVLSPQQQRVCDLLVIGLSNKEIARELGIGRRTVEAHRELVYRKLEVRNVVELVRKTLGAEV
jgi:DNA-binding CsgD family transcriptional regulator